jgi:hypothetical protein
MSLSLTEGACVDNPVQVLNKSVHDTYRTLGVHISPSVTTKTSFKVLLGKAQDYHDKIASSKLPREAALLSYNMYLLPKLGYPLLALTFSEEECNSIQSPTIMAFLPKIHLNRNTAGSIVFGSYRFGGLNIKSLYSIQSLGQITLFVGHLHAYDKTSKLIRISLSYLQLAVGSTISVLNLSAKTYKGWTDNIWLLSFWKFLNKVGLIITFSQLWLPTLTRQSDVALMDFYIERGFSTNVLGTLNRCRLYLQVLTLSNIVSADGLCIVPDVFLGIPLSDRKSTLRWPYQQ